MEIATLAAVDAQQGAKGLKPAASQTVSLQSTDLTAVHHREVRSLGNKKLAALQ